MQLFTIFVKKFVKIGEDSVVEFAPKLKSVFQSFGAIFWQNFC